ncbi:MAG: undecaprenyl-diphosphate phosphatase [FCB group bacterium]|nr:undecaprenyl-diphosphate phosphatase [FCB group bacterium]
MHPIQVVVFSVVEGLTEFLPVSSTAHLILTAKLFNVPGTDFVKLFEVVIQSGAVLAVVFLYLKMVWLNKKIWLWLTYSFLPTAIVGLFLYKIIKGVFFESFLGIAINLIWLGIGFLIVEKFIRKGRIHLVKTVNDIGWREAVFIGLGQSLAVFPGVSRAGAVILTMLLLRYKRKDAVVYSFLLSVPTILAASAYDLLKFSQRATLTASQLTPLLIGTVLSFIFAVFAVKWLIRFVQKHSLAGFGYYRITLGLIILLIMLLNNVGLF